MTEGAGIDAAGTQECPFCIAEIPSEAVRCQRCGADIRRLGKPVDLGGFWAAGILLALLGLVVAAVSGGQGGGAWFGLIVLGLGGVLLQIATVATGVSIGMRDRDEKRHVGRYGNAAETGAWKRE